MDGQRFDHLTKGFARAIGRRQALRTLGRVAVLGLITTAIGRDNARGQHSTCPYPCAAGLTCCNGRCWDTNTTQHHCGRCGNSCGPPLGTGGCCGGTCVNHATDPNHCGQCNRVCGPTEFCGPSPLGVPGCRACPAGQQRCGNACFDFRTDTRNCGGCGVVCTPGMECQNGRCTSPSYPPRTGGLRWRLYRSPDRPGSLRKVWSQLPVQIQYLLRWPLSLQFLTDQLR
jgi:Stigma-specific protein, Stig1